MGPLRCAGVTIGCFLMISLSFPLSPSAKGYYGGACSSPCKGSDTPLCGGICTYSGNPPRCNNCVAASTGNFTCSLKKYGNEENPRDICKEKGEQCKCGNGNCECSGGGNIGG